MPTRSAFLRSGKVRDLYEVGSDRILLVASDRISAFDVVLPTTIDDKGRVLTGLSRFWFGETGGIVANHLVSTEPTDLPAGWSTDEEDASLLRGRMMLCRRADVVPIEAVVRGYVSGSGWKEYLASGSICGIDLPAGLRESGRLAEPIFTPATKAPAGEHDENIGFDAMVERVGGNLAERIRDVSLALYRFGAARVGEAGMILADTKFEFGIDPTTGELILIDEVLTPDSSRFWDSARYEPGGAQASFDKQFVRDWLETQAWDKTDPGPELPADVVAGTRMRYVEAYERITRASFERYLADDRIGS
ncbi:MAG TPA: phosphoribosylaminoimidazolesuccinocarboxamide synthase [Candidatus Limnocylindrales bacterium]|nr:phosphoribosylaminoimidazolesuccinocarboxamide synthase [Candidatus Limnocylindrales bacterium]